MIVLNEKEERLLQTIRALPPDTTDHILQWTSRLAELAAGKPIDWSDSWTDEDMRDAGAASLERFEESEPGAH